MKKKIELIKSMEKYASNLEIRRIKEKIEELAKVVNVLAEAHNEGMLLAGYKVQATFIIKFEDWVSDEFKPFKDCLSAKGIMIITKVNGGRTFTHMLMYKVNGIYYLERPRIDCGSTIYCRCLIKMPEQCLTHLKQIRGDTFV